VEILLQPICFPPVPLSPEAVSRQDEVVHALSVNRHGAVIDAGVDSAASSATSTTTRPSLSPAVASHSTAVVVVRRLAATAIVAPAAVSRWRSSTTIPVTATRRRARSGSRARARSLPVTVAAILALVWRLLLLLLLLLLLAATPAAFPERAQPLLNALALLLAGFQILLPTARHLAHAICLALRVLQPSAP
jgi:hypothetical protein